MMQNNQSKEVYVQHSGMCSSLGIKPRQVDVIGWGTGEFLGRMKTNFEW